MAPPPDVPGPDAGDVAPEAGAPDLAAPDGAPPDVPAGPDAVGPDLGPGPDTVPPPDAAGDGPPGNDTPGADAQDVAGDQPSCLTDPDVCDDDSPCTDDFCNASSGLCVHEPVAAGTPCNDGSACTFDDACADGACVGLAVSCEDFNVCTDDRCDPGQGVCLHEPNDAPCDDLDPLTDVDVCIDGDCVGSCTRRCEGRVCGDDGCGGSCGSCPDTEHCVEGACAPNCPPYCAAIPGCGSANVYPGNGHAYYVCGGGARAQDAEAFCATHGGYLASLTDADENNYVAALAADHDSVWLGGHDRAEEGRFVWSSGEAWQFTAWSRGEPNNGTWWWEEEDCVELAPEDREWNDLDCAEERPFVCEIPVR